MKIAIAVGCAKYADDSIVDLQYPDRDADEFARLMIDVAGIELQNVLVLKSSDGDAEAQSTRLNILRRLSMLPRGKIDALFFFYSGHGYHSNGSDYLLAADSLTIALEETSLRFETILRLLQSTGAPHTLLFLDACRTPLEAGKSSSNSLTAIDVASICPPGMVSFASCEPGQISYESDVRELGVFTASLSDALSDVGRCTTVYELDLFLHESVPKLSQISKRPPQQAYTRVEPLSLQAFRVASPLKRNLWLSATPLGIERRTRLSPWPSEKLDRIDASPILAIDFGTSYSAAAIIDRTGQVQLVQNEGDRALVPSVVAILQDSSYLVGESAVDAERSRAAVSIRNVKRLIGTDDTEQVLGRSVAPEFLASLVIRNLRDAAEDRIGVPINRCIGSYPANYSLSQQASLLGAFEMAGLEVVRMVGEPNIAAILLEAEIDPAGSHRCLVVDVGGGTTDVAVIEVEQTIVELKSVSGSNRLGGLDFDLAVAQLIERLFPNSYRSVLRQNLMRRLLMQEAERVKRGLGNHDEMWVRLDGIETPGGDFADLELRLDRSQFRDATSSLNETIRRLIERAISEANLSDPVDTVLISGQGGKIFTVREIILECVEPNVVVYDHFQESAVVRGLAHQAAVLSGIHKNVLLLDTSHRDVGIEVGHRIRRPNSSGVDNEEESDEAIYVPKGNARTVAGDNVDLFTIAPRNRSIPYRRAEHFTFCGDEDDIQFRIFAGVGDDDVEFLGTVKIFAPGREVFLAVGVNMDASSTRLVEITNRTHNIVYVIQLSNFYTRGFSQFDLDVVKVRTLLNGIRISDMRELRSGEVALGYSDHHSIAFVDLDIDEFLRVSMERSTALINSSTYVPDDLFLESHLVFGELSNQIDVLISVDRPAEVVRPCLDFISYAIRHRCYSAADRAISHVLEACALIRADLAIDLIRKTSEILRGLPTHVESADLDYWKREHLAALQKNGLSRLHRSEYRKYLTWDSDRYGTGNR